MFFIALAAIVLLAAADQIIKYAVVKNIPLDSEPIEVIKIGGKKIFSLDHIRNSGAAWSIMQGKTWFLVLLPIVVCAFAVWYMYRIRRGSKLELFSIALMVAGGIGNLIDRIRIKEVVDYIKFEPISFPIFNFADICVVIGAILFCICALFLSSDKDKKMTETVKEEQPDKAVNDDEKSEA
ncbi:MAG: signal peptidase II [Ruminococcus sp.]|nr:signal peptidase II [Ruminococcus sp.]